VWSSFLKKSSENIQNEDFSLSFYFKRSNFDAFFRPSTLKTDFFSKKKLRVGYVYREESFDIIFNMGYGGAYSPPPPHGLCVGKITHGLKGYTNSE